MEVSSWRFDQFHQIFTNVNTVEYEPRKELKLHGYRVGLFSAYAGLVIIGAGGNIWVISVISRLLRQPRTEAPRSVQIYIFSLCCFDLLALSFIPLLLLDFAYGQWIIPVPWLCKLYFTSESISKFGAPFLLTTLTSFCYFSICHQSRLASNSNSSTRSLFRAIPQKNTIANNNFICKPTSPRFACVLVSFCSAAVLALLTPMYIYSDLYYITVTNGSDIHLLLPKCILQPPELVLTVFTIYSFILGYLLPLILITFFYASVLRYVRRNDKWMRVERTERFWRVAKTSMGLVGFYIICWTPYWAMSLYHYFTPQTKTTSTGQGGRTLTGLLFSYFIHMLPYICDSGFPILYTLLNRRIRDDYSKARAVIRDRKRRRQMAQEETRGSVFSSGSFSNNNTPPPGGAFAWLWAFSRRQRYSAYALRRCQLYSSGASNNSATELSLQKIDTVNTQPIVINNT